MKFNVNRVDNMVIQAIFLLDTLDKDINSFSMRVRFVTTIPNYYFNSKLYALKNKVNLSLSMETKL